MNKLLNFVGATTVFVILFGFGIQVSAGGDVYIGKDYCNTTQTTPLLIWALAK